MERKISKLESVIVITTYSNSFGYGNNAENTFQYCSLNLLRIQSKYFQPYHLTLFTKVHDHLLVSDYGDFFFSAYTHRSINVEKNN